MSVRIRGVRARQLAVRTSFGLPAATAMTQVLTDSTCASPYGSDHAGLNAFERREGEEELLDAGLALEGDDDLVVGAGGLAGDDDAFSEFWMAHVISGGEGLERRGSVVVAKGRAQARPRRSGVGDLMVAVRHHLPVGRP